MARFFDNNDGTWLALGALGLMGLATSVAAAGEPRLHPGGSASTDTGLDARSFYVLTDQGDVYGPYADGTHAWQDADEYNEVNWQVSEAVALQGDDPALRPIPGQPPVVLSPNQLPGW
jgi:hypothetical protein